MTGAHELLTLQIRETDEGREFRSACSCGWASIWESTNRVGSRGRRHVQAHRRRELKEAQASKAAQA